MIKSRIYKEERIDNAQRKFGADPEYFPCTIVRWDGTEVPALFTRHELNVAMERAAKNPEDVR